VLAKLQNLIQPEELDAVILSHYHSDHLADIGVLQYARLIKGTLGKALPTLPIFGHHFDQHEFNKLTFKEITHGEGYSGNEILSVGPFQIAFLKTDHPVPCYAMRIEADGKAIVYTADSSFKEEFVDFSKNADLLVCECNFYGHQNGKSAGHMNSIEAGKLAQRAEVKQLILTHLPHFGNLPDLASEASKEFDGQVRLAEEFLSINL
jgi:ribonuclease BN (tRNA processing enzyme)